MLFSPGLSAALLNLRHEFFQNDVQVLEKDMFDGKTNHSLLPSELMPRIISKPLSDLQSFPFFPLFFLNLGIGIAVAVLLVIIFLSLCVRRRRRAQFNSTSFATSSANNNQTSNPYAAGGQSQYQQGYAQGGYNQGYNAQSPAVGYNQYPPPQGAPPMKESEGEMVDGQPFNPSQTGNYAPPPGPPPPTYQKET